MYCGGCRLRAYCSRECQKKDWKGHKENCGVYPREPGSRCNLLPKWRQKEDAAAVAARTGRSPELLRRAAEARERAQNTPVWHQLALRKLFKVGAELHPRDFIIEFAPDNETALPRLTAPIASLFGKDHPVFSAAQAQWRDAGGPMLVYDSDGGYEIVGLYPPKMDFDKEPERIRAALSRACVVPRTLSPVNDAPAGIAYTCVIPPTESDERAAHEMAEQSDREWFNIALKRALSSLRPSPPPIDDISRGGGSCVHPRPFRSFPFLRLSE